MQRAGRAAMRRVPGAGSLFAMTASLALVAALALALSYSVALGLAVVGGVATICLLTISHIRIATVGVILIAMFCFTSSWDVVTLGGVDLRQACLVLGGILLVTTSDIRSFPPVPWWLHAYGLSALIITCLQVISPVNSAYLVSRYETSSIGQDLGERPSGLVSLLSFLFNAYAIPIVIVMACMVIPTALRWLIGAYIAGGAVSCMIAAAGYFGAGGILELVGAIPIPAGQRGAGLTSHPLRLATAAAMAVAPACWAALKGNTFIGWVGRCCLPILLLGLYVSGSRAGMVAGVAAAAACAVLLPPVRERIHVIVGGAGVLLTGLFLVMPDRFLAVAESTRLTGDTTTIVSDAGRVELLAQGLQDFQTSPVFGIGIQFIAEAHSLYIGILASGGLIFAAGFALFYGGCIRDCYRALPYDRVLGGALLATLGVSVWYWTVAFTIQTNVVAAIFGFVLAFVWLSRRSEHEPRDPYADPGASLRESRA